jgi:glycosyltransferase involved in cell wall biosynthesis
MTPPSLTAIILAYNESRHIEACMASLRFADHILVFDSGSTDGTPDLARAAGAEVRARPFQNYPDQRNAALGAVSTEWVLFVDADERVTPELAAEVRAVIQTPQHSGYWIPRHNYIFGRLTRHTGWYPDYQMRLLRREEAQYDPGRLVHELVILKSGEGGYLKEHLTHYNYENLAQFQAKQARYAQLDADMLSREGVRPKIYTPYTQAVRHFKWRFWDLEGYKDGLHGLRLSYLMARYERRKYALLRAAQGASNKSAST